MLLLALGRREGRRCDAPGIVFLLLAAWVDRSCTEFIFKRATRTPPAKAGGVQAAPRCQKFHSWQICRSLGARYGPSPDIYGPVWGWL